MKWTSDRSSKAHAAKARLRMERAEQGLGVPEFERVPRGEYLGTLQWQAADGQVRRWVVCQGSRANNITVRALVPGQETGVRMRTWTWMMDRLRRVLAVKRVQMR